MTKETFILHDTNANCGSIVYRHNTIQRYNHNMADTSHESTPYQQLVDAIDAILADLISAAKEHLLLRLKQRDAESAYSLDVKDIIEVLSIQKDDARFKDPMVSLPDDASECEECESIYLKKDMTEMSTYEYSCGTCLVAAARIQELSKKK